MGSLLLVALAVAGVLTIGLGVWHLGVPRWFAFREALAAGPDEPPAMGTVRVGPWAYPRRRADVLGLSWVMSNAASYVLITIGVADLAWSLGDRTIPLGVGAAWIAGWWVIRAASQAAVGRRPLDGAVAVVFAALGVLHGIVALGASAA